MTICSAKIQISCMCCLLAPFSSLVVNKGSSYWISPFWGEIYHFFSHHNKKNRNLSLISLSSTLVGLQRFPRAKKQIWRGRPLVVVHRGHRWLLAPDSHLSCGTSFFPALLSSLFAECSGGGGELRAVSRPSDKGVRSATVSGWAGSVVGTCA